MFDIILQQQGTGTLTRSRVHHTRSSYPKSIPSKPSHLHKLRNLAVPVVNRLDQLPRLVRTKQRFRQPPKLFLDPDRLRLGMPGFGVLNRKDVPSGKRRVGGPLELRPVGEGNNHLGLVPRRIPAPRKLNLDPLFNQTPCIRVLLNSAVGPRRKTARIPSKGGDGDGMPEGKLGFQSRLGVGNIAHVLGEPFDRQMDLLDVAWCRWRREATKRSGGRINRRVGVVTTERSEGRLVPFAFKLQLAQTSLPARMVLEQIVPRMPPPTPPLARKPILCHPMLRPLEIPVLRMTVHESLLAFQCVEAGLKPAFGEEGGEKTVVACLARVKGFRVRAEKRFQASGLGSRQTEGVGGLFDGESEEVAARCRGADRAQRPRGVEPAARVQIRVDEDAEAGGYFEAGDKGG